MCWNDLEWKFRKIRHKYCIFKEYKSYRILYCDINKWVVLNSCIWNEILHELVLKLI